MPVVVNQALTYQAIDGFGVNLVATAGMTDADAALMFGTGTGIGLSIVRVAITSKALIERPSTSPDPEVIASSVVPSDALSGCQRAMAYGVKVVACGWNGVYLPAYADPAAWTAIVKAFIQNCATDGVTLWGIATVNEPNSTRFGAVDPVDGREFPTVDWANLNTALRTMLQQNFPALKHLAPDYISSNPGYELWPWVNTQYGVHSDRVTWHQYSTNFRTVPGPGSVTAMSPADFGGAPIWMMETCDLTAFDPSIASALLFAKGCHDALTVGNCSAWLYWSYSDCGADAALLDSNAGLLRGSGSSSPKQQTKRMWALGNFSRFVRPGSRRLDVSGAPAGVSVSAYRTPTGTAIVAINQNATPTAADFSGVMGATTATPYRTSATEDLQALPTVAVSGGAFSTTLASSSITTFTLDTPAYGADLAFAVSAAVAHDAAYAPPPGAAFAVTAGATQDAAFAPPGTGSTAYAASLGAALDAAYADTAVEAFGAQLGARLDAEAMPPLVVSWLARVVRSALSWVAGPWQPFLLAPSDAITEAVHLALGMDARVDYSTWDGFAAHLDASADAAFGPAFADGPAPFLSRLDVALDGNWRPWVPPAVFPRIRLSIAGPTITLALRTRSIRLELVPGPTIALSLRTEGP